MSLPHYLSERRQALGISMSEAAVRAGVGYWLWRRIEKPPKEPRPRREVLAKMAAALGVDLAELEREADADAQAAGVAR